MLKRVPTTFSGPRPFQIGKMQLADCPMSDELASILEHLNIHSFDDVDHLSLEQLRHYGDKNGSLALELGCLIRRAALGEFGWPPEPPLHSPEVAGFWWKPSPARPERAESEEEAEQDRSTAFSIPEKLRDISIWHVPMSGRLKYRLVGGGLQFVGGLHGVTERQLLTLRSFGPKCLQELREVVQGLVRGELAPQPPERRKEPPRFVIPQPLLDQSPYQFALSRRLDGALRRAGIACFGDLNGAEFQELLRLRKCGPGTVRELLSVIERAAGSPAKNEQPTLGRAE